MLRFFALAALCALTYAPRLSGDEACHPTTDCLMPQMHITHTYFVLEWSRPSWTLWRSYLFYLELTGYLPPYHPTYYVYTCEHLGELHSRATSPRHGLHSALCLCPQHCQPTPGSDMPGVLMC
ncbi:hypothetical protein V8C26DRAFT_400155 [Trichoderma gracile]